MEQAIEKQEEQKPTRRKKEKKGMAHAAAAGAVGCCDCGLRNVMGTVLVNGVFHGAELFTMAILCLSIS